MKKIKFIAFLLISVLLLGCEKTTDKTAADILGNPQYLAISYGGYREKTRDIVPTVEQLKEDMQILEAMGIKIIRTYNTQQYAQAANILEAIHQLKTANPEFEMYVMLGAWIDCEGAWTGSPNHEKEDPVNNKAEIDAAVKLANQYPDIVKIIAVGNEAMVHWATSYFVRPNVILKWVNHLQGLKKSNELPKDVWITSSDNFASWGGENAYHGDDLAALINAVDFVSLHTYPFHDSHYNPDFWIVPEEEANLTNIEKADAAMLRAKEYAISQYQSAANYIESVAPGKAIHIGETGWASIASSNYGATGSQAADEYKGKLYYNHMRDWTNDAGISCFYFEAFDEKWKDAGNELGSENHFGLINLEGQAKYALWDMVDAGIFEGLTRDGVSITKTYKGDENAMMADLLTVPTLADLGIFEITNTNKNRKPGDKVNENVYVVANNAMVPGEANNSTYPSAKLKINAWNGTCGIEMSSVGIIKVATGTGDWWGCALEMQSDGVGENLTDFSNGHMHFTIKGNTTSAFQVGFQTGVFNDGTQINNYAVFGPGRDYSISQEWKEFSIAISELNKGADLADVNALVFIKGEAEFDGKMIYLKDIYYTSN
jgi:exo-beta-1,3-glucanase (GH17 family)